MPASPIFPDLPADWTENEIKVVNGSIHLRQWLKRQRSPEGRPKALFVVHGFGEHSDRYRHLPSELGAHVDVVIAFDHWGHGKSAGSRGDTERAATWLDTTLGAWKEAQKICPEHDWTWLGHSFGGLITLALLHRSLLPPVQNLFVSAPLLALKMKVPPIKKKMGELIEPILPHLSLKNEIDPHVVSHDLTVVKHYKDDKLNHDRITPRAFLEMNLLMDEVRAWNPAKYAPVTQGLSGQVAAPLLNLILPGADPLVDSATTREWFLRLDESQQPKKLFELPGFFHESLNEKERALAFNILRTQMNERTRG